VLLVAVVVEADDVGDLSVADLLAILTEARAHLDEVRPGVDELNLAPAGSGPCGW